MQVPCRTSFAMSAHRQNFIDKESVTFVLQTVKNHLKAVWPVTIRRFNAQSDKDKQALLKTLNKDSDALKKRL